MHGLLDQEIVGNKVAAWSAEHADDFWLYRPSSTSTDGSTGDQLLLIYQSQWQRRLLLRYGQQLVFLDATYKTTQYALPLFFLCVHTNCGYVVTAVFAIEREDSASLSEALTELSQSVPQWRPAAFMIDASEIEVTAINTVFAGTHT